MNNYSLTTSLYSRDLISNQALVESMASNFYASKYSIDELSTFSKLTCEGNLLLEFSLSDFIKDNMANVLQAGIGYALETGISVGTLGVGAPAGVAAEMINDMVFFGYSAGDALLSIKNLFQELGNLKDSVQAMLTSTVKDAPKIIYNRVKDVINNIGPLFERAGLNVKKGIEKLKDLYRKLMVKFAKVAGDTLALISPIPGTDTLVQNAIVEFADDAFKVFTNLFDKLPAFAKEYVNNPSSMKKDIFKVVDITIRFIKSVYGKKDNEQQSLLSKIGNTVKDMALIGPVGIIMKNSGAYDKIITWLESSAKDLIEKSLNTYKEIYPIMLSLASALTILVNDDHDLFKQKSSKPVNSMSNENYIYEEIGRNFHTLNNDPYSWKDNTDLESEIYINGDGTWSASIKSISSPELSTPLRNFSDEASAAAWMDKHVDIITRKQLNK